MGVLATARYGDARLERAREHISTQHAHPAKKNELTKRTALSKTKRLGVTLEPTGKIERARYMGFHRVDRVACLSEEE